MTAAAPARYLELGFDLDRHIPGFVDAYFGPPELRERRDGAGERPAAEIAAAAATLRAELEEGAGLEPARARRLSAQVLGLETTARRLAGEQIAYRDEVERCFGVRPVRTPEHELRAAHERLDAALPGTGALAERYRGWVDAQRLGPEPLLRGAVALSEVLRERTRELVGLPDGEAVTLELVGDESWLAFNYYLGGLRSRVVFNTDVPLPAYELPHAVAHELYPGHHTEHAWKEQELVRRRGWIEESALLVATPRALVSEGVAEIAFELAFPHTGEVAEILHGIGIVYDAEVAAAVTEAREPLAALSLDAALLLHEEGAAREEALDYLMTWGLNDRPRAEKALEFVMHPTWRSYVVCYSGGQRLCRPWVGDDPVRFRRLLVEALLPEDLAAAS